MKDLAPFPGTHIQKSNEGTGLEDYEDLVNDAKRSITKAILPRLSLPKEFVESSKMSGKEVDFEDSTKTIDKGNEVDVEESSAEDLDVSTNRQSNVTRSGRVSKFPSRYTDNY